MWFETCMLLVLRILVCTLTFIKSVGILCVYSKPLSEFRLKSWTENEPRQMQLFYNSVLLSNVCVIESGAEDKKKKVKRKPRALLVLEDHLSEKRRSSRVRQFFPLFFS